MSDLLSLFNDLVRFETQLWNALDSRLRVELGIPLGRFETLQVLGRRGPCRVNDIADDLVITWGGTSKIVDRLEASGLCRRRPNPEDGRSSLIDLTEPGHQVLARGEALMLDELARRVQGPLPQRRLQDLAGTLVRLRAAAYASEPA
ncbi:MarR family winged helix-turn-helix transcriptional regulator [Actinoplanes sp. N902-109]|uniref:MarR family winged helix-turn-helix transcriptional regulator n=1 Tax=Actinoplanes sp. (strain N902-109) TaxID=649831 RepID=UPI000329493C|nr:MarR family winged helix-turn-helix transcriptional regulator [Actinoplanes sp. N902-109]AGL16341.1 transcriptional regulator [Actinoplanes sp. N902-109]